MEEGLLPGEFADDGVAERLWDEASVGRDLGNEKSRERGGENDQDDRFLTGNLS
jgi:hypothetical protein